MQVFRVHLNYYNVCINANLLNRMLHVAYAFSVHYRKMISDTLTKNTHNYFVNCSPILSDVQMPNGVAFETTDINIVIYHNFVLQHFCTHFT